MKYGFDLEIGDTLYRPQFSEWCTIKGVTRDRHDSKVFEFNGFLVSTPALPKIFENTRGRFVVKEKSNG